MRALLALLLAIVLLVGWAWSTQRERYPLAPMPLRVVMPEDLDR